MDFGDSQCLCRPIRVMAPDSDRAFSSCMNRDCEVEESEGRFARGHPGSAFAPTLDSRKNLTKRAEIRLHIQGH